MLVLGIPLLQSYGKVLNLNHHKCFIMEGGSPEISCNQYRAGCVHKGGPSHTQHTTQCITQFEFATEERLGMYIKIR